MCEPKGLALSSPLTDAQGRQLCFPPPSLLRCCRHSVSAEHLPSPSIYTLCISLSFSRLAINERSANPPVAGQELIPAYPKMKISHRAHAYDILSRLVVGQQEAKRQEFAQVDICIWSTAALAWHDWALEAYALIWALHVDLGFNESRYGGWEDVPIPRIAQQCVKRRLMNGEARARHDEVAEHKEDTEIN